jgi:hypothetical protein
VQNELFFLKIFQNISTPKTVASSFPDKIDPCGGTIAFSVSLSGSVLGLTVLGVHGAGVVDGMRVHDKAGLHQTPVVHR